MGLCATRRPARRARGSSCYCRVDFSFADGYRAAMCDYWVRCGNAAETCPERDTSRQLRIFITEGHVIVDPMAAAACLAELNARHCHSDLVSETILNTFSNCRLGFAAQLPPGQPGYAEVECSDMGQCAEGLVCKNLWANQLDGPGAFTTPGACTKPSPIGGPCTDRPGAVNVTGCAAGLDCVSGACQPSPPKVPDGGKCFQ